MAKTKRDTQPDQSADLLDEVFDAEALNPALQRLYGELGVGPDGTDVTVHVTLFRKDGKEARVWSGQPDDYDLMEIARQHGSGDYRVKLYARAKTGHMVPATGGNRVFPIQLTPAEDAAIKTQRENPGAVPGAAPAAITPDTIRAMIAETVKAIQPAQVDPFAQMERLAAVMKAMQPAAPAQVAAPLAGINLGDVIKTVFGMAGEVARLKSAGGAADTPRRGATGADIWIRLVEKFGEPLLQAVYANRMQLPPAGAPAANAAPIIPGAAAMSDQPLAAQPAPSAIQPENAIMAQFADLQLDETSLQQLRFGIAFLQAQAAAGHDPVTYANVVLDQLERQPGNPLERILDLPDPLAFLLTVAPDIEPQREWFKALIDELNAPEEPDEPAEIPHIQH